MADDSRVVAGSTGERAAVTRLLLDVANNRTLRELSHGDDVADRKLSLLAAVYEGTSVETLSRDESLLAKLVAVRVAENDTRERSTTTAHLSMCLRALGFAWVHTGQSRG